MPSCRATRSIIDDDDVPAHVGCSQLATTAAGFCILTLVTSRGVVTIEVRTAPTDAANACSTRSNLTAGASAEGRASGAEDDAAMGHGLNS